MRRTPAAARSRGSGSRLHLRDRRIARRGGWTSAQAREKRHEHAGSGDQEDGEALRQLRERRMDADELQARGSGGAQGTRNEPSVDEMNGDPVEQDRADHLVNAATYLEPSREQPPQPAGRCRGGKAPEHRSRDVDLPHDRGGEPAPDELSLGADVEEPDGEGHGYRKPGENQDRALDGRLAQRPGASEGTGEQIAESCDRVSSGNRDGEEAGEKRDEERGDRTPERIARRREEAGGEIRQPPAPDPASSSPAAPRG